MTNPHERLRYHVTGAIERGEGKAIVAIELPELPHGCNSWIVEDTRTGKAVVELFNRKNVEKVLASGPTIYRAHSAVAWLAALNAAPPNTARMGVER